MANLSITTAWNETVAFVAREGRLLFPMAFMLAALPLALMQALTPAPPGPNELPEPGLWLALFPLGLIGALIANVAISQLALRPGTSVGEAIVRGTTRLPALLGAYLLLGLAGAAGLFVMAMFVAMLMPGAVTAAQAGSPTPQLGLAMLLIAALMLPVLLYFGARLVLLPPLAAVEPAGPIDLIRRSWQLTRGHVARMIGFLLLFGIAMAVVSTALEAVAGVVFALVLGPLGPGSLSTLLVILVMAAFSTVLTVYFYSMLARLYAQLTHDGAPGVFA